ncbi:hypothetical protein [Actinoplanes sp. NPDC020271]|uniref:hypothetical protein n=1 Tax=Actinoplanes sp. NPDC020271 TaxID=3363896 RepID=UPI00379E44FA
MISERDAAVDQLWEAHRNALFPERLRYDDVAGVDMVLLDASIAGCVSTWLNEAVDLDDWRRGILAACERDLGVALPTLSGQEATYCQRLLEMTVLILRSLDDRSPG